MVPSPRGRRASAAVALALVPSLFWAGGAAAALEQQHVAPAAPAADQGNGQHGSHRQRGRAVGPGVVDQVFGAGAHDLPPVKAEHQVAVTPLGWEGGGVGPAARRVPTASWAPSRC